MSSVLITGANRGIGLGLTRHMLDEEAVSIVIATTRSRDTATDLQALDSPKLHIISLEVDNEESITVAANEVCQIIGDNGLDFLINNAGIGYFVPLDGDISKKTIMEQLDVNAVGPLLIANAFFPLLKRAALRKGSAQVVNISSSLGSLENAMRTGKEKPFTPLGMSKAALNMLTRRIAVEWKDEGVRATSFCPGWVRTNERTQMATYTVDESTIPLTKLILSLGEEHNGHFYQHTGESIPW